MEAGATRTTGGAVPLAMLRRRGDHTIATGLAGTSLKQLAPLALLVVAAIFRELLAAEALMVAVPLAPPMPVDSPHRPVPPVAVPVVELLATVR